MLPYRGIKVRELSRFVVEKIYFLIFGVMLLAILYGIKTSVSQFSQLFPEGLYKYAAIIFLSGIICVWMLMMFKPTVALFLLLALLPLGARLSEYFSLEIGDIVVTADVIAIWISALISIGVHGFRRDRLLTYYWLFIALVIFSSLVNLDSLAPTIILFGIVTPLIVYGLFVSVVRDMQGIKLMVNALGFVIVFCSLFAFMQPFINDNIADYFYLRLPSVFYSPVIFANVIILLWPFTLIYEPLGSGGLPKLTFAFRVIGVAVSLVALLLTGSRGGVAVCGLQIFWLLGKFRGSNQHYARRVRYAAYIMIFGILIIGFLNADFLLDTVLRRFAQTDFLEQGSSANERMLGALGGLELGFSNPIFGVGLGGFKDAYLSTSSASAGELELESAHNFILNLFAEVGTLGVALWLFIIASAIRRLGIAKDWLYSRHEPALYIVVKSSFIGYTATQFLFYGEFLHKNVGLPMILYFVVFGLVSSLYFMQRDEDRSIRA